MTLNLYAYMCVCAFSLHRESPDMIMEDKPLISEVVLSQCPSEAEEKDLLEPDRLKALASLQKYQDETKAWRDSKVKL
jgi:hypothetical protein